MRDRSSALRLTRADVESPRIRATRVVVVVAALLASAAAAEAQSGRLFNEQLLEVFVYRNVGPFRMGARISDIAVPASPANDHLHTFYVGTWSGGLWKTTNNGTTFEPVFDDQSTLAIGDVALAPSNPDIVWVGTGDAFTSRSSYAGDGVYKSTDGGKTWRNMGLEDTQHIARIVVHPTNPEIVYVASMGHLYSRNSQRGVFKTTDGGANWEKVLYINDGVGVVDLVLDPRDPGILYAATYEKQRLPWRYINGGPESGIYKTSNGGRTWTRLGGGLPTGRIGRIGLAIYPRNPDIVYAVVENANPRSAREAARAVEAGERVESIGGEVYRTEDGGQTWAKMNSEEDDVSSKGPYYFSQIRVDPNNDQNLFVTGVTLGNSTDGGRTWHDIEWPPRRLFTGIFGDVRTLWIDPENSDRIVLGSDGGVFVSYDGGRTSDHYANLPLGEVYAIGADMQDPYNIYAGLQDHENWKGPSNGPMGEVWVSDWVALGNGDGMFTLPDPSNSRWLYTTRQYGGLHRVDQQLGYRTDITPEREEGQPPYRFIWAAPIHISPHNSNVIYTGAQALLRSADRGDTWTEISPDLSTNPTDKILPSSEGGIPGGIPWFAISSISESPLTPGVIWVGTSDGKVQLTRDGGETWTDMTSRIAAAGGRQDAYVSRVRASAHVAGRAYVAKRGYKFDDFRPYLYRTDDFGATWTAIASNLPDGPINVVYEDHTNPDLLFVGNDTGVFVSIDGGSRWVEMNGNMPNVPVHDLLVHPRENDLVVGTYGRGIWLTNIAPLQEVDETVLAEAVHLFSIEPTVQRMTWAFGANNYLFGQRHLATPNEQNGAVIRYYLRTSADSASRVVIENSRGEEIARLEGGAAAGINTVVWDTRIDRDERNGRGGGDAFLDRWAPLGEYTVALEVGGRRLTGSARIVGTQGWSLGTQPQVVRSDTPEAVVLEDDLSPTRAGAVPSQAADERESLVRPRGALVEQTSPGTGAPARLVASFDGLGFGFEGPHGPSSGRNPSDNSLAVGPNHIVQTVNSRMAIFTKKGERFGRTGRVLYGAVPTNTVFKGFGGACEAHNNGDAVVRYDQLADRWLIVMPIFRRGQERPDQPAPWTARERAYVSPPGVAGQPGAAAPLFVPPAAPPSAEDSARGERRERRGERAPELDGPYSMCYAVSTGPDPMGSYYRYEFLRPLFPDYPRPAVWPDGYYVPTSTGDDVIQKHACVVDRKRMLAGEPAMEQCVIIDDVNFLNNADLLGKTLPPAGVPNIMMATGGTQLRGDFEDDGIYIWQFHVDWDDPANTAVTGPEKIPVAPYHYLCDGQLTNCVPQPGTDQHLDAQGDKLMARVVYRNVNGQESIVAVHSVATEAGAGGVRWYEFTVDGGRTVRLRQQGTYAPDRSYRWMASPAIDGHGNIGIGYSFGGTPHFPGQRFAGRLANDPLGVLTMHEAVLVEGQGAQENTLRWEDYTQTAIDPGDDCTIWYVGDYYKDGAPTYSTRIGAFQLPGCPAGS